MARFASDIFWSCRHCWFAAGAAVILFAPVILIGLSL